MDPEDLPRLLAWLEAIAEDRAALAALTPELRQRLVRAAARVASPDRVDRRRLAKAFRRKDQAARVELDRARLESTGMRVDRKRPLFLTPPPPALDALPPPERPRLEQARSCYICKTDFRELHPFYDALCPICAELNWGKRQQSVPLPGRTALVTGARVKIGFQAAVKLLRAGARVLVTTRFPRDAARRYAELPDFEAWSHRLQVFGLDLVHTPSVERFCRALLEREERLDFIINNACQTVRRPPGFYAHLAAAEGAPAEALREPERRVLEVHHGLLAPALPAGPAGRIARVRPAAEEPAERGLFPAGALDQDEQQIDLRSVNSWRLRLHEVPTLELLEVHLVNAVAPFVLNARLKPLLLRTGERDKHIVNVSAMEGQFYRTFKTERHPHTNMAKAALNMLTRTSAVDYAKDGIHMNSVDTGWVTDEDPAPIARRKAEDGFSPPLDVVDGAARILDPIFSGLATGEHAFGLFFKDYRPTEW